MASLDTNLKSHSNRFIRLGTRQPMFGVDSTYPLQLAPRPPCPIRIAVIGNHLPRQWYSADDGGSIYNG